MAEDQTGLPTGQQGVGIPEVWPLNATGTHLPSAVPLAHRPTLLAPTLPIPLFLAPTDSCLFR